MSLLIRHDLGIHYLTDLVGNGQREFVASGESFDDYGLNLRGRLHFTYEWLWSRSSVRVTRPDRDLSWPVIPPNLKEEASQWRR
jgi:hypothetical protein